MKNKFFDNLMQIQCGTIYYSLQETVRHKLEFKKICYIVNIWGIYLSRRRQSQQSVTWQL